ncbi:MAG: TlpA family protein disulfide reductase [Aquincola sp.]|nr:TlpA family protein disulfide reductase [Aquincola sp.]MDH5328657.1 TlpA family protein disulfide reductase [Aquincola sp.]
MKRSENGSRRWILASGLGVAAAAAGAGWALWRLQRTGEEDIAPLWSMAFDTPSGGHIEMASLRGRPLLINFWATWCAPCIREMPALDRFAREFAGRGWVVFGLAADSADMVREFLLRTPVSYPIGLAGFGGIELSRRLGNQEGGLPFTVLIDRSGRVARRHVGELQPEQLRSWVEGIS